MFVCIGTGSVDACRWMLPDEEVFSFVDEEDRNAKAKRRRVLRAADVMPPFDKGIAPADSESEDEPTPALPRASTADGQAAEAETPTVKIPTYDLAEHILAEQRRVAGRRRRAPGKTDDEPPPATRRDESHVFFSAPTPQDLQELQRIVAEIVARDIERLCRRSNGQASAQQRS